MELLVEPPSLLALAMMANNSCGADKSVVSSCPECQENARKGYLKEYSVNLEECLVICNNDKCCYMSDKTSVQPTVMDDTNDMGLDDIGDMFNSLFNSDGMHSLELTNHTVSPIQEPSQTSLYTLGSLEHSNSPSVTTSIPTCKDSNSPSVTTSIPTCRDSNIQTTSNLILPSVPKTNQLTTSAKRPKVVSCRQDYIMLWSNIDALCWLDVLLCMLCHNESVRVVCQSLPYSSVIKKMLVAYDESQALIAPLQSSHRNILHSVIEQDRHQLPVKRGGGYCMNSSSSILDTISNCKALSSQDISVAKRKIHLAGIKLECAREEIWQTIEQFLKCERGKDDSPVNAFPVLVKTEEEVSKLFLTEYSWRVNCAVCHHQQVTSGNDMITFPKIAKQFDLDRGVALHEQTCSKCLSPNQQRKLCVTRYAPNLVIHFAEGMSQCNVDDLCFTTETSVQYTVSAVIEYKTSPNHFAVWTRNRRLSQTGNWMCYDDLMSQYAQFSIEQLQIPPHNIHIVLWESAELDSCPLTLPTAIVNMPATPTNETSANVNMPATPTNETSTIISTASTDELSSLGNTHNTSANESSTTVNGFPDLPSTGSSYQTTCASNPLQTCQSTCVDRKIAVDYSKLPNNWQQSSTSSSIKVSPLPNQRKITPVSPLPNQRKTTPMSPLPNQKKTTSTINTPASIYTLGNVSKSLKSNKYVRSCNNNAEFTAGGETVRKPVALLTSRLGSKPIAKLPLTEGLSYGSSPLNATNTGNHGSYNDIIGTLSKLNTPRSNSVVSPSSGTSAGQTKVGRPSNKSYLDLVKPLLEKNKLQKGKLLSGYVPKSKRQNSTEISPAKAKHKKVMFTVTDNDKETKRWQKTTATVGDVNPPISATPVKAVRSKAKVSNIVDNFVKYEPSKRIVSPAKAVCLDDMPSLDDMLNDFMC